MYSVRQTDCRTGWQVVDNRGKVIATYRQKTSADDHKNDLNKGASA